MERHEADLRSICTDHCPERVAEIPTQYFGQWRDFPVDTDGDRPAMRDDMSEVIIERPRWGSRMGHDRRTRRSRPQGRDPRAIRSVPFQIGLRRAGQARAHDKTLNENLAPLRRYLERQVNRPWDKVWSEISQNLGVDQHGAAARARPCRRFRRDADIHEGRRGLGQDRRLRPAPLGEPRTASTSIRAPGCCGGTSTTQAGRRKRRARMPAAARSNARRACAELAPDLRCTSSDERGWWEVRLALDPDARVTETLATGERRTILSVRPVQRCRDRGRLTTCRARALRPRRRLRGCEAAAVARRDQQALRCRAR